VADAYAKVHPLHGLNTRANEDGLPEPEATIAQNCRFGSGGFQKRTGSVRVLYATSTAKSMDFDAASSEYVAAPIDVRVWTLPTKFTIEVCVSPDIVTGTRTVFYAGATTPSVALDTDSSSWRWRIWDSAGTLSTVTVGAASLSTTQTIALYRDGASLTSRLDNVAGGTGTMSATLATRAPVGDLRIARNGGTDYFDGKIDYVRGFAIVRANHADRLLRFVDPKAEYVLFNYGGPASGTTVLDESRWENHGEAFNTPAVATTLCHNPAPVRAIHAYTNYDRAKRVFAQAGSALFDVVVP
jgi:hypothetical protein